MMEKGEYRMAALHPTPRSVNPDRRDFYTDVNGHLERTFGSLESLGLLRK